MLADNNHNPTDPKRELYLSQVKLLNTFLESGAIDKAQWTKSYTCMTEKMGMQGVWEEYENENDHL